MSTEGCPNACVDGVVECWSPGGPCEVLPAYPCQSCGPCQFCATTSPRGAKPGYGEAMTKYAVQAGNLSPTIYVGRANAKGDAFAEKEEATDMVLAAVAQYVDQHFEGGMEVTFPGLGKRVRITVTDLDEPTDA